jgi:hypothetical protein
VWERIAARIAQRDLDVQARADWLARWFDMRTLGSLAAGLLPLPQTSEKPFASAVELALSVEPAASAPMLPSGPLVYRGLCGKLWRVKTPS